MRNFIIKLVVERLGAGKALELISGKKTYISGGGLILLGVGQLLLEIVPALSADDKVGAVVALAPNLVKSEGAQRVLEGLGLLGMRHAIAKSEPGAVVVLAPDSAPK